MSNKQFTGIDGALFADGVKIAKIQNWSFNANAGVLETTTLGDFARSYIYGVQAFTGNCSLLYYEGDAGKIVGSALLDDVMRTTQTPTDSTHEIELRYMNGAVNHVVRFDCLLPNVQISASVGEIVQAQVSFTVTGPLKASTIS